MLARFAHLRLYPLVGLLQAGAQRRLRAPGKLLVDEAVVRVAAAYAGRSRHVADLDALAGDRDHGAGELVDGHHFIRADIDRPLEARAHQPAHALDAFVDIEKRARLPAVAPDLDRAAVSRLRHFARHGRRCLLAPAAPCALRAEDVV